MIQKLSQSLSLRMRLSWFWRPIVLTRTPLLLLVLALPTGLAQAQEILLTVRQFRIEGENPISQEKTQILLSRFLGEHRDLAGLEAAADALEEEIRRQGNSFGRVILPAQVPRDGIVTLQVVDFKIGRVIINGNRHFSEANIRRSLPDLHEGGVADTLQISQNLAIANQQSSKRLKLAMKLGDVPDRINAEIAVSDESPLSFFVSANNTGSPETGKTRLSFGVQHSNLFDRDHTLQAIYTTSPGYLQAIKQYGLTYAVPVYDIGAVVSFFTTKSETDSGVIGDFFNVTGSGNFSGMRFRQQWPSSLSRWSQAISLELENKTYMNSISAVGAPAAGALVTRLTNRPFSFKYELRKTGVAHRVALFAQLSANTGGSGQTEYSETRSGSSPNWHFWKAGLEASWSMDADWVTTARYRVQQTRDLLVPGEQFGIGGAYSVRGFKERETSGDNGQQLNLELTTPRLWELQPVLFIDAGARKYNEDVAGTPRTQFIASAGVGFRWNPFTDTSISVDFAQALMAIDGGTKNGDRKAHLSIFQRF